MSKQLIERKIDEKEFAEYEILVWGIPTRSEPVLTFILLAELKRIMHPFMLTSKKRPIVQPIKYFELIHSKTKLLKRGAFYL
jgi:hypothetical protein